MNTDNNLISLNGGEIYLTQKESDAFKIKSGTVLIYAVPLRKSKPGRRSYIYTAREGEVIPAFSYRDIEYCEWRFCFSASGSARLQRIADGSTKRLRAAFAEKAGLQNFEKEGFCGAIVDRYRLNTVTEDSFIRRTHNKRNEAADNINTLINNALGKNKRIITENSSSSLLYNAVHMLCEHLGVPIVPYEKIKTAVISDIGIKDIAAVSHFSCREISLPSGWHKKFSDSFIAFSDKNKPIVCIFEKNGYRLWDIENKCALPLEKRILDTLSSRGFIIYTSLPAKTLSAGEVFSFCKKRIRRSDILKLILAVLLISAVSVALPLFCSVLFRSVSVSQEKSSLFFAGMVFILPAFVNMLLYCVKASVTDSLSRRVAGELQNGVYTRVFSLSESFFRSFDSADLAARIMRTGPCVYEAVASAVNVAASCIISLFCLAVALFFSRSLTVVGLGLLFVLSLLYAAVSAFAMRHGKELPRKHTKSSSLMYQLLGGISKIRIAGVEDRALYEYLKNYINELETEEKRDKLISYGKLLKGIADSLFVAVFLITVSALKQNISVGFFVAFCVAFTLLFSYVLQGIDSFAVCLNELSVLRMTAPVFSAAPENDGAKELLGDFSGAIEINNVNFSYSDDSPAVLKGISLEIKAGEYVGIVGTSGCGKSTLMKLILGFEKPDSGKIYFDNKDIENIDKSDLRRHIGVVLQDGKLISGSILENITVTRPDASVKEVRKVADAVGLSEDIASMPMGYHTVLSEDCDTLSGGQIQRILIARALLSDPDILMFDEATSALDNTSQKMICDALEKLSATKIVIAHRLTTVRSCDRIIVLDDGRVAEQGTYEELMENGSLFSKLADRQLL